MNQSTKIILISLLTATLISCQKSDTNDLQEAQLCLNTAPASEAMNCVSKISGNTTENAYKLRCSAVFIANGFGSPSSFISALDQIKNGGNDTGCSGSCSGSLVAMTSLNFGTSQSDLDEASLAFNQCNQSGVGIYSQISSIFKIGTLLARTAGSTNITNIESAAAALASNSAEVVGEVIQATYITACADTSKASESTKQYCAELSTAISGVATPAKIGQCFVKKMAEPTFDCSTL
jgi:hypothetical protein